MTESWAGPGYEAKLRVPFGELSSASSQQKSNYGLKVYVVASSDLILMVPTKRSDFHVTHR